MSLITISSSQYKMWRKSSAIGAVAIVILMTGCASEGSSDLPITGSTTEFQGPILQGAVDYQSYESGEELARASRYAIVGKTLSAEGTWLQSKYEGDDPWLNPLAGTGREPSAQELALAATPITANSVEIIESLGSPFEAGDVVEVFTPGGNVDGVRYEFAGVTEFEVGAEYLFFIDGEDGTQLGVIAVSEGAFKKSDAGGYVNEQGHHLTLEEASRYLGNQ